MIVSNSTVANNTAGSEAGGLYALQSSVLHNSIIAGNRGDNRLWNCEQDQLAIASAGYNLSDNDDCSLVDATDQINTVASLDSSGGARLGSLLEGSAAIDVGDDDLCPQADVYGTLRPQDGDDDGQARCDIGAFEFVGGPSDVLFQNGFE